MNISEIFTASISSADLVTVLFLVFLEGVLSVDNAIVLALIASDLPHDQKKKALTYGLAGAVIFRFISLFFVTELMAWRWVKFVGGGYLVYLAVKHYLEKEQDEEQGKKPRKTRGFWGTVLVIELMDIAFAVDSILAAVALSKKFWVVFTGGLIGVILMRFAASAFTNLLEKFPALETSAFHLVALVGTKLILEGFHFHAIDFHSASNPAFWIFWGLMALAFASGFRKSTEK